MIKQLKGGDTTGLSWAPIVHHCSCASTSFVLAALRALHVDPYLAVMKGGSYRGQPINFLSITGHY